MSIAAVDGDGPVAGAVFVPTTDELFSAARGHGAHLDGRPLHCSTKTDLATALVGTGFSYQPGRRGEQGMVIAALLSRVRDIRRFGAASVDLCSVAAGRLDAYFEEGLAPWDLAAGEIIAREAGAVLSDLEGGPVRPGSVVACPPALHRAFLDLLGALGPPRSSGCTPKPLPIGHDGGVGTRILTVEDDERIRAAVKLALEDEGWTVMESGNGEDAVEQFHRQPADVVLIDLMLPGMDGFELCRSIRRQSDVPIIMVTARNDTHDVVAGLEAGADDYMTKPFVPKELSARIRALLRRARPPQPGHARLVFGELELIPDEGKVLVNGEEVHLTKTEFRLLCELAANPGKVLSRESLLDRVWGYGYFGDGRLVDVHVRRLRTKIEADPANPRHVVTVRGLGYRLQA